MAELTASCPAKTSLAHAPYDSLLIEAMSTDESTYTTDLPLFISPPLVYVRALQGAKVRHHPLQAVLTALLPKPFLQSEVELDGLPVHFERFRPLLQEPQFLKPCLLYTSDAADE